MFGSILNIIQFMQVKKHLLLLPAACILLFIILYIVATFHYPGGSQADIHSIGFSWKNNYWCNLLNENAINGEVNPARAWAMSGMAILCAGLIIFWIQFACFYVKNKYWKAVIPVSGTLAMIGGYFSYTNLHDVIINFASACGLIALAGTMVAIYSLRWRTLFRWGLLNMLLVLINNVFYYNPSLIQYLPVIQKITFLIFLLWFIFFSWRMYGFSELKSIKTREVV